MLLQENLFDLEPAILERLRERLAGLQPPVKLLTAADLDGVSENSQFTPAVHLIYRGYSVAETLRSDNSAARITQEWLAVVATRSQKALRAGDAARENGGAIAMAVCSALMGFKPAGASKPMKLANAPDAGYSAGFHYLPMAFEAEMILQPKRETP